MPYVCTVGVSFLRRALARFTLLRIIFSQHDECLFTEAKRQWAFFLMGWVSTLVHYLSLMGLQLVLADQNPFRKAYTSSKVLGFNRIFFMNKVQ